ncbi:glycerophosphodiester phosphodiesterase family protein [Phaeobacter porticola]|uniref:Glycerophosphoryl diester phosphodiesterase-like protein n=1 Tax=Phaeobacter porticola TaxID=1844006 RepID=A0A1L3I1Q1_9RHOB|nr:glycerophosphodiester phosphodiesterase family protein [Phaeobacter porticola]APG46018.1 glycerophosphoryl diester phosphodiesterase-like protein [Phaeobacter porticola]
MTSDLPAAFLRQPITHRALHDVRDGRPENSRAAILAAIKAGYGVEMDLQLSSDGRAMVFHDYNLERLAEGAGLVADHTRDQLRSIPLKGGDGECIPDLAEILDLVDGRVPLLIELKDQDGNMGPNVGALERDTVEQLQGYKGDVALMSFNPHSVAALAKLAPELPRGITTSGYDPVKWTELGAETCDHLRAIPDFDRVGACFISHEMQDLARERVAELRAMGVPILCWTVTSAEMETEARKIAHNVTFERYLSDFAT